MSQTLSQNDLQLLNKKGITVEELEEQINLFKKGFPYLEIANSATVEKGITSIEEGSQNEYIDIWDKYCQSGHSITKFVPASGAASRMFKDLFEFLDADDNIPSGSVKHFFDNLSKFAFYTDLDQACVKQRGKSISQLIRDNEHRAIIKTLLEKDGLNYGNLPKGLLKFHTYTDYARTPAEEHLVEGALYTKDRNSKVELHFTVSPEHRAYFEALIDSVLNKYESTFKVVFSISFSEQKKNTDTIAVGMDNNVFRDNGQLLFRPGGHGALIENLNDLSADIIFVKNIDNVVPDKGKEEESRYKKILAGYLVKVQKQIFEYLRLIDSGTYSRENLIEILYFLQNQLNIKNPDTKYLEDSELALYLKSKLNRPIRVCGMVKNIGEPGGGPFFTVNKDSTVSLQILESSQIDLNDPLKKEMFDKGTHFNPVDLVCAVKDYLGNKFNLKNFIDKDTGFISIKSKNGVTLKALELPGLWNGSMSDWNTIFVEVPLSTFNPVKTVNDLLRSEHQPDKF